MRKSFDHEVLSLKHAFVCYSTKIKAERYGSIVEVLFPELRSESFSAFSNIYQQSFYLNRLGERYWSIIFEIFLTKTR